MIWTYIYDFLIQYVYGGVDSGGAYHLASLGGDDYTYNQMVNVFNNNMRFGNYLALITTIIIMALIVWFTIWLVIWVFKLVSHAFLLK